ncbi:MAG TPA: chemotaxis protein CheA, partial [Kiloniellales bacterium]
LQVLDVVNGMFQQVRAGIDPEPANADLLERLRSFASAAAGAEEPVAAQPAPAPAKPTPKPSRAVAPASVVEQALDAMLDAGAPSAAASPDADAITEDEFEALLDELHGQGQAPGAATAGGEITEDEFEQLLDELHGKGRKPGVAKAPAGTKSGAGKKEKTVAPPPVVPTPASAAPPAVGADEITDDEFERLLDDLHGKGQPPRVPAAVQPHAAPVRPAAHEDEEGGAAEERRAPVAAAGKTAAPAQPAAETTVRVDTQRLDEIMNMVGELVLVRNRLQNLKLTLNDEQIAKAVENLDVVTSDLQLAVMKTRMQPIKKVFGRFPRVVRDLARSLKKEVNLELRGEETDLDKNLVEALADPLVHLVRNAVDHGIEMPDERAAAGKRREGTVILTASQEGNHIQLTIEDDGKGMDPDLLRRKAVEKGLTDAEGAARLDARECFNLIFLPGFSTKTEISDVSGRGVGMDVVKTRISQMNGSVEIDSAAGKGSRIVIKLPLTLAIMPTLMVRLSQQIFALPLSSVVEILDLDLGKTNTVDGRLVVVVRERAMPLFYLSEWLIRDRYFGEERRKKVRGHVVVVSAAGRHVGFVVDHLIGQEEVVIKALGAKLRTVPGLAGATITGDGMIALILDVPGLVRHYVS